MCEPLCGLCLSNWLLCFGMLEALECFYTLSYAFILFQTLPNAFKHFYMLSYAFKRFHTLTYAFMRFRMLSYAFLCFPMLSYAFIRFHMLLLCFYLLLHDSLEQEEEMLYLCLTGFYLRKPVKTTRNPIFYLHDS